MHLSNSLTISAHFSSSITGCLLLSFDDTEHLECSSSSILFLASDDVISFVAAVTASKKSESLYSNAFLASSNQSSVSRSASSSSFSPSSIFSSSSSTSSISLNFLKKSKKSLVLLFCSVFKIDVCSVDRPGIDDTIPPPPPFSSPNASGFVSKLLPKTSILSLVNIPLSLIIPPSVWLSKNPRIDSKTDDDNFLVTGALFLVALTLLFLRVDF
ncbi:wsv140 [White spot syndrome virus]|uniref:Wsv140 n=4 Tax=White spot syndrome virus TaxID=342409 RepID=Q8VB55_WSSVS|nr:wsv140 [Shrimp white spot syndrome virus]AFX59516.1 wsv140 [White spot syndrome virus]AAL33144.1 wsv140 [Shrimp white spot syndrome virus]AAL89063.1 WSSV195 [Shrimp white spot syndrome virus]AWQ60325.1 wsv140 [Shrimp white spot syndrome virus]AWQ60739.1 wsv140 [Shrimp white spot syndrome virus]